MKSIIKRCFMLSVGQGVDGQKGEKGECRIDDNLVSVLHSNLPISGLLNTLKDHNIC